LSSSLMTNVINGDQFVANDIRTRLVRLYYSEGGQRLLTLHRLPRENHLIAANRPLFAVNLDSPCGLGATMSWLAGVLAYSREQRMVLRVIVTNRNYAVSPGHDWLGEYFIRKGALCEDSMAPPLLKEQYVRTSIHLLGRIRNSYRELTLQQVHDLFFGSIEFSGELLSEAASFCDAHGIGSQTIGVHYRGTDKRSDATQVAWKNMVTTISATLNSRTRNIFVASDEPEFIAFIRKAFDSFEVIDLNCAELYPGRPAHLTRGDPKTKASEAIRTIIVLSRCGLLIKNRSQLSSWAKLYNPTLPTIVLGRLLVSDLFTFPEDLVRTDVDL
jgi:hypothetical protein